MGSLSYKDLKNRVDYLTKIIFPGISAKVNIMQKKMINTFNKKIHIEDILFPDGSYVMITDVTRRSKLDLIYESPYKVIWQTQNRSYMLQDSDSTLLLQNYSPSALKLIFQDLILSGKFYKVKAICDHRDNIYN